MAVESQATAPGLGHYGVSGRTDIRRKWLRAFLLVNIAACVTLSGQPCAASVQDQAEAVQKRRLAALGSVLFRTPRLSGDGTVSCSTCHVPELGFSGAQPIANGVVGYRSGRHAPGLLGLRAEGPFMWDGRAPTLREQIPIPLESPEMAVDWSGALHTLNADPRVTALASAADIGRLDRGAVIAALASYLSTLEGGSSRFDRYYYGHDESALSAQEAWGFRLFVHKAHCSSCHLLNSVSAPLTDGTFHATGIGFAGGQQQDPGRARVTGKASDFGRFKTPSLRNVALRPYLMHDGSLSSLTQAVEFYNQGAARNAPNLDARLRPLHLDQSEVMAIVTFLGALTSDEIGTVP